MADHSIDTGMDTHRLVITEDLNQYGRLFGGRLLGWADEACFIAATLKYPHCKFVTIGMDHVEFKHGVKVGTILAIRTTLVKKGVTSITSLVQVYKGQFEKGNEIFETQVTFVNVDSDGNKQPI